MDTKNEIREFLTSRRARITPDQAGLRTYGGGTRRVPGLRREEVAILAGVSVDYYTRLERGNAAGVSDTVLESLSRALQLDETERAHLFDLTSAAQMSPQRRRRRTQQRIRPTVQHMLDAMYGVPAFVRNGRLDILGANRLFRALYSGHFDGSTQPVNTARFVFLDPAPPPSTSTGTASRTTSSPSSGRKPAATRTTVSSPTSSASCRRAASCSGRSGPPTTCTTTTPGSSVSSTRSSAS